MDRLPDTMRYIEDYATELRTQGPHFVDEVRANCG